MIELVDYNELLQKEPKPTKAKTRRSRGKAKAMVNESTAVPQVSTNEGEEALATQPSQVTPAKPQDSKIEAQEVQPAASQPTTQEGETSTPEVSDEASANADKDQ